LKFISEDGKIRNSLFILLEMDPDSTVRKEAERALVANGILLMDGDAKMRGSRAHESADEGEEGNEDLSHTNDRMKAYSMAGTAGLRNAAGGKPRYNISHENGELRVPTMGGGALPEQLQGHSLDEVEIYFRESLVGEQEQRAVIDQVKEMAAAAIVIREVEQMEKDSPTLPLYDFDFLQTVK
jgi:hypothetical protein